MDTSTIIVLALTLITVLFLVYIELKSRRNSAADRQNSAAEKAESRLSAKEKEAS